MTAAKGPIRFGVFEADLMSRTLRKRGARVRLQELPFRLLAMLLARPGEVVTREELKNELWAEEDYGEFDLGLNTAVKKLRQALDDSANTPRFIETIPKVGYRFIGSAAVATTDVEAPPKAELPGRREWLWRVGSASVGALAVSAWFTRKADPAREAYRFTIDPPEGTTIRNFELSPDGRHIAFIAGEEEQSRLWLRSFADEEMVASPIKGTESADPQGTPFWSPDSREIGFFADGKLKRVGIGGEPVVELADAKSGRGGTWNERGDIVFCPFNSGELSRLQRTTDRGAEPEPLTTGEQNSHRSPHFLPDGERYVFWVRPGAAGDGRGELRLGALHLQEGQWLTDAESHGVFFQSPSRRDGYLLTVRRDVLMAHLFDPVSGRITGDAFAAAQDIGVDVNMGRGLFSISTTGTLAHSAGGEAVPAGSLWWVDRKGIDIASVGPEGSYRGLRISPDGKRVAVQIARNGFGAELATIDLDSGVLFQPAPRFRGQGLVWTRDSAAMLATVAVATFLVPADGSSQPQRVSRHGRVSQVTDRSPSGHLLVESWDHEDLLLMLLHASAEPEYFIETDSRIAGARFSPDGRHIAYSSNESGVDEVYVQRFPERDQKGKVSLDGGSHPVWGRDGRELFYVSPRNELTAAHIDHSGDRLRFNQRQALFPVDEAVRLGGGRRFDVSPDGKRFIVFRRSLPLRSEPAPIVVVLNWDVELEQKSKERAALSGG